MQLAFAPGQERSTDHGRDQHLTTSHRHGHYNRSHSTTSAAQNRCPDETTLEQSTSWRARGGVANPELLRRHRKNLSRLVVRSSLRNAHPMGLLYFVLPANDAAAQQSVKQNFGATRKFESLSKAAIKRARLVTLGDVAKAGKAVVARFPNRRFRASPNGTQISFPSSDKNEVIDSLLIEKYGRGSGRSDGDDRDLLMELVAELATLAGPQIIVNDCDDPTQFWVCAGPEKNKPSPKAPSKKPRGMNNREIIIGKDADGNVHPELQAIFDAAEKMSPTKKPVPKRSKSKPKTKKPAAKSKQSKPNATNIAPIKRKKAKSSPRGRR